MARIARRSWVPILCTAAAVLIGLVICRVAKGEVNSETSGIAYTGDGSQTDFTFTFGVFATTDLRVVQRTIATGVETLLTLNSDYTVADDDADGDYWDGPGGTVTLTSAPSSAYEVHISRKPALTQTTDLDGTLYLRLAALEDALDKMVTQTQYLRRVLYRALLIPETEGQVRDVNVPNSVDRASGYLGFDASGDLQIVATAIPDANVSPYWDAVIDDVNLAASLASMGLSSTIQAFVQDANSLEAKQTINADGMWDIRDFGAIGTDEINDVNAIQAAIDKAHAVGSGTVFIPQGTFYFNNLTLYNNITLRGVSATHSILKRITGSTGTAIEDYDNAAGICIEKLMVHGNSCSGDLIRLGWNGTQWGTTGRLSHLYLRETPDDALDLSANVGFINTVACSATGTNKSYARLSGSLTFATTLTHMASGADYGIIVNGDGTCLQGVHTEGYHTTGAIDVNAHDVVIQGVASTIAPSQTTGAIVAIRANKRGCQVQGLSVILQAASTLTAAIVDDAYSTGRTVIGRTGYTSSYRYVDAYISGPEPALTRMQAETSAGPSAGEWWKGDWALRFQTDVGEAWGYVCTAQGTPGTWVAMGTAPGAVAKTGNYHVQLADQGTRFSNDGAVDGDADPNTITFTLKSATIGQMYSFAVIDANDIIIDPNSTQLFRGQGAGKYLRLDDQAAHVTIHCLEAGIWDIRDAYDPNITDSAIFKWEP